MRVHIRIGSHADITHTRTTGIRRYGLRDNGMLNWIEHHCLIILSRDSQRTTIHMKLNQRTALAGKHADATQCTDKGEAVCRYAEREGYETVQAYDGSEAIELCAKEDFDLIIMDAMMPETDGFTACRKIRESRDIPVLMLSARGTEFDKLFGFEVGVDDYVTKPFSPKELMARIKVILRRHCADPVKKSGTIKISGLEIDTLGHNVSIDGNRLELTAKEYAVLLYLVKNKGIVLSRDQILNEVWGYEYFGDDRTVDWQIKLLRSKLGDYRGYIHTIRGVGYKFEA